MWNQINLLLSPYLRWTRMASATVTTVLITPIISGMIARSMVVTATRSLTTGVVTV